MISRFFIYGAIGWVTEIIWTGLGSLIKGDTTLRAWTFLWMFPIYGSGVLLEPLHDRIRVMPWVLRALVWLNIIWGIEYFCGAFLNMVIGTCPWDYSASRFSVSGYIRLDYAPVWMAAGLIFERIHDHLDRVRVNRT